VDEHLQTVAAWSALETEVGRFRTWADSLPDDHASEWEPGYAGWRELRSAFDHFVGTTSCAQWTTEMVRTLLYAIARDTDTEHLARSLAQNPDNVLCVAEQAVKLAERNATYQLAAELGSLTQRTDEAEALLLRFAHDDEEYVRRRALRALADLHSSHVPELIDAAWNTGIEHARMAVLYALRKTNSPHLADYLAQAEADGRQYLVGYASKMRAGEPVE